MSDDASARGTRREPRLLEASSLWEYALRLLGNRALSVSEVRQKLRKKARNIEDVDPVISRLRDYGALNDIQFAESYASARRDREGFGKMRVLRDLKLRRVAPRLAEEAVKRAFENTDELQMIETFLERKFRGVNLTQHLKDPRQLRSVYRKLRYAGFGVGNCVRVLKRYATQPEELECLEEEERATSLPEDQA